MPGSLPLRLASRQLSHLHPKKIAKASNHMKTHPGNRFRTDIAPIGSKQSGSQFDLRCTSNVPRNRCRVVSARRGDVEAPNFKLQAPEKSQGPNFNLCSDVLCGRWVKGQVTDSVISVFTEIHI